MPLVRVVDQDVRAAMETLGMSKDEQLNVLRVSQEVGPTASSPAHSLHHILYWIRAYTSAAPSLKSQSRRAHVAAV